MSGASAYHDVHLTEHPARQGVWRVITDYLAPWIPAHADVLEIGAGHCHWINAVRASTRLAVDLWPDVGRFAAAGVETRVMDAARELRSLPAGHFDVVLASNVLEHFEPDIANRIAGDVAVLLKPGGRFLIIQPNYRYAYRNYFDDYTHRAVFTDVSLANMLRSHGFSIAVSKPRFLPYSMRSVRGSVPAWLVRAYLHSPVKPGAGQMLIVATRP
ncbi:MAG: class I SAM-dependent methyltransferase [Vicinamibacterales bacterium]